jgi:Ca2+-binding RTX toxin-like protein
LAFTTVRSATGVDFIGTPGVDVGIIFDETGNVTLSGLGDADIIQVNNSTLIQRTSSLNGGDGADQITFVGTSISDSSINGNKGADIISLAGSVSNSFVGGGEGSDNISGGTQYLASKIEGGAGSDTISLAPSLALATVNGGDGNDTIKLFSGLLNSSSINGNAGNDIISGNGLTFTLSGTNFIGGGAGDDTINFAGTTDGVAGFAKGFDLTGGSGNDIINGSDENDTIWGNADNDTIQGNQGKDTIYAGAGKDTINVLNSDSGDVITGGAGGDIYSKVGAATSTFIINSIAESAAATTGTAAAATLTFDSFTGYAFAAGDVLNISAVTNQLAGGPYAGPTSTTGMPLLGVAATYTDFGQLKAALDALSVTASSAAGIKAYSFTTAIGPAPATPAASYVWIQDSQSSYSSTDLLFQTAAGGFGANGIVLV